MPPDTDPLFDPAEGARLRDEGMARALRGDHGGYALAARAAAEALPRGVVFNTDQVIKAMVEAGIDLPKRKFWLGPVMTGAARDGVIAKVPGERPTDMKSAHRRPKQMWVRL